MTRRACVLLVCALIPIGLVTACGGGSSASTHAKATPGRSPLSLRAELGKAIVACQKGIDSSPYISASDKVAGQADCAGVRTGNIAAIARLRGILRKACEALAIAKVPSANRAAALAACRKVYR